MGETYLSERRLGAALTPARPTSRPAGPATITGGLEPPPPLIGAMFVLTTSHSRNLKRWCTAVKEYWLWVFQPGGKEISIENSCLISNSNLISGQWELVWATSSMLPAARGPWLTRDEMHYLQFWQSITLEFLGHSPNLKGFNRWEGKIESCIVLLTNAKYGAMGFPPAGTCLVGRLIDHSDEHLITSICKSGDFQSSLPLLRTL